MTKILYLMRHGQTVFNLKGKIQGASDSPLTDHGIEQAQAAARYFENNHIEFDTLFSSSQERACDTLENAVPNHQHNYVRLKGLKEWHFGVFEGESIELLKKIKQPKTLYGDYVVPFGGESRVQVEQRMTDTLTEIMEHHCGKTTLAVSHGSTIGLFIRRCLGYEEGSSFDIGNCHILKFEYQDGQFNFIELIDPTL